MEQALGARVQTTVVEAVAEGADSERVMRDLAAQGHQLIFATSFGYLEPALRVAAEFPDVKFEHAGGYKTAANLNTYNARYYEARYLAGWLAGKTSKTRHRRLRGGLPGARGGAGHQRLRARHARGQPEGAGARAVARTPGSTRRASARRRRR